MFKNIAPQKVQHESGYIVQSGGRYSLQYLDGDLAAEIKVDRGPTIIGLFPNSMMIRQGGAQNAPLPAEKSLIMDRVVKALEHWGMEYTIYED